MTLNHCACLVTLGRWRTKIRIPILLLFVAALAVLDWLALVFHWQRIGYLTKPAVLLALLAWFTLAAGWQGQLFWFGMGLVFSLAGDIVLMSPNLFLAGLIAFLLAHIFYIVGFNPTAIPLNTVSITFTLLVWLGAILFFRRLSAAVREKEETALLQYPILFYSLAISIMLLSALVTLVRPDWPLAAALLAAGGGLLFTFSDGLLAVNRFIRLVPHGQLWVRISYHLGQIALIAGVALRYGLSMR